LTGIIRLPRSLWHRDHDQVMGSDEHGNPPPAAEGSRLPWTAIPAHLRVTVERQLGGRVVAAVTQPGGFSPGVAARLRLDDGRRAFVKAVGDVNPQSPDIHRAEARIAAALPPGTPAPRLLGCIDADGSVILTLEDIEGRMPAMPWRAAQLDRVLAAMTDLATGLTPAPFDAPEAVTRFATLGRGWRELAKSGPAGAAGLDPWAATHLDELVALESDWAAAASGRSLVHADIRADNILLAPGRVVFVDWPWACLAAPWFDLVAMLPSVAMQGGPQPEEILVRHPLARGVDPAAITAVAAAFAGMFVWLAGRPDPPGLPTLRAFQRAQGTAALAWLHRRTGWR
jgi:aminoglycoside phosphotransferase (APT) family kinase protein